MAVLVAALAVTGSSAAHSGGGSANAALRQFKSPSGNINCALFDDVNGKPSAECLVRSQTWPRLPRKPRSCDLDWVPTEIDLEGRNVFLGTCRGDIGPLCFGAHCSTLGYGHSLTLGGIRCTSTVTGMTCRQLTGGRQGFKIAREGYVLYR